MSTSATIKSDNLFPVVGIGASAGGLDAFKKFIRAIPDNSGMAYVLVQHLDPTHVSMLPEILQKVTNIPVLEISDDIKVLPDHIYVIPANKMMVATDGVLQLTPRPPKNRNERNLPIDLFFTSLAEVHQSHAIGVVLSGTASDGTLGLKAIKDHGGMTFAQDEESAAYEGMPNSAAQAGVVDFILAPELIPAKLLEVTKIMRPLASDEVNLPLEEEEAYKQIVLLLRIQKGTDFTYYKQTTIRRRIARRMALNKNETAAAYLVYLKNNRTEQDVLYQDMLIPVTSFFRDHKTFDALCDQVFPLVMRAKTSNDPVRIWVAACSTGQEAYSIAICLREFLASSAWTGSASGVQIYGSDISVPAIAKARNGTYKKNELKGITPQRLDEYFIKTNGLYQLNKTIRNMCVFTVHNFLKDPPFGKMDLISCRNALIYMEPYLQKKALATFHYALNPKGILLLGKSESISGASELFGSAVEKDKFFSRKDAPNQFVRQASRFAEPGYTDGPASNVYKETARADFQKTADDMMLRKYTPPGVVVNDSMDIVHFRGMVGDYLEQSPGKPSHHLLKMIKYGLAFELRNILRRAKKDQKAVIKENISIEVNGVPRNISIEAAPIPNTVEPHYLVLFHDLHSTGAKRVAQAVRKPAALIDNKDLHIQQLEQELAQLREDMRDVTSDQATANEELQTSNEELLSSSEELQSLNEELETGKEELQSANEELTVVNQEMVTLNEQVTDARNYAEAVIGAIREPLIVLDKNLRVSAANNAFYRTFKFSEAETEDVFFYELGDKEWNIPALRKLLEDVLPGKNIFNDFEVTRTFLKIGLRTMSLNAREVVIVNSLERFILLSIEDITERKMAVAALVESEERFRSMAERLPQLVWVTNEKGDSEYASRRWKAYSGVEAASAEPWKNIVHPEDLEQISAAWKHSLTTAEMFKSDVRLKSKTGDYNWFSVKADPVFNAEHHLVKWVGAFTDVQTEKTLSQLLEGQVKSRTIELADANRQLLAKNAELEKANKELQSFNYVSSHDLQEPLRKIQTFVSRIYKNERENLSDAGQADVQRIQTSAQRMRQLLDDLLSFSIVNMAERVFTLADLDEIIEDLKEEFQEELLQKNGIVETTSMGCAMIIPFQFRQLFHNLIGNSLKFSKPGLPLVIRISCDTVAGANLPKLRLDRALTYYHLIFSDNGIGFDPQFKDKIFEVFQRLHGKTEYAGTGVGLAIVKKIIDNHRGLITATGELGKGARFDMYIPAG